MNCIVFRPFNIHLQLDWVCKLLDTLPKVARIKVLIEVFDVCLTAYAMVMHNELVTNDVEYF
ncbi:MAG: hypothetical protein ABS37_03265 [Acidovorax sp. SCN 65-108]|nr:MAG: hypothetical protein ABS37_03265 [Acidovorax sp. SCN 65-108]OJV70911.1 MAG: hypothetical protein BGO35_20170 [Burkholderiales bacterium 64-34]